MNSLSEEKLKDWKDIHESITELLGHKPPPLLNPENRFCTCRAESKSSRGYEISKRVVSFFVPGWAIHLNADGTWKADEDCEEE
jgi:hypothetical protein